MSRPGVIHAGSPETSARIRATLDILVERGERGATTAEIQARTGSMAPGTDVAELRVYLRRRGQAVRCDYQGKSANGAKIYRYFLVSCIPPAVNAGELFRMRSTGVDPQSVEVE